ncbi:MAG TPA: hypothetical protein VGG71_03915 [Chitinophagaceae bacterium]|jgi:hypothetical protein
MKILFLVGLCAFYISSSAQQKTVDVSSGDVSPLAPSFFTVVGGEPVVNAKFAKLVEGSPYFKDDWLKGWVMINGGQEFAGVYLKLDLYDNQVHFKDNSGNEMIATTTVKKLTLFDSSAQEVYNFINGSFIITNNKLTGWYQTLADGKVSLFKQYKKQLREDRPYGSATFEQSIFTSPHYFVLVNGDFKEIKKIKDFPDVLSEKKEPLSQYIKTNNLSGKTDDDFINLINYFNGLN